MKNKSLTAIGAEIGIVFGIIFSVFIVSWLTYESQLDISLFEVTNMSVGLVFATLILLVSIVVIIPVYSVNVLRKLSLQQPIISSTLMLNAAMAGGAIACMVIILFGVSVFTSLPVEISALSQAVVLYSAYLIVAALALAVVEMLILMIIRSLAPATKKKK